MPVALLAAILAIDFFMADPDRWITVTSADEVTWTDGIDTWVGLPGCKSAGMIGLSLSCAAAVGTLPPPELLEAQ